MAAAIKQGLVSTVPLNCSQHFIFFLISTYILFAELFSCWFYYNGINSLIRKLSYSGSVIKNESNYGILPPLDKKKECITFHVVFKIMKAINIYIGLYTKKTYENLIEQSVMPLCPANFLHLFDKLKVTFPLLKLYSNANFILCISHSFIALPFYILG